LTRPIQAQVVLATTHIRIQDKQLHHLSIVIITHMLLMHTGIFATNIPTPIPAQQAPQVDIRTPLIYQASTPPPLADILTLLMYQDFPLPAPAHILIPLTHLTPQHPPNPAYHLTTLSLLL